MMNKKNRSESFALYVLSSESRVVRIYRVSPVLYVLSSESRAVSTIE